MPEKPTHEALEKKIQELEKNAGVLQETESGVKYRLAFEQLIAEISSELAGARNEDIDSVINSGLASIGAFTMADRAYIFQFKENTNKVDNTYEWCADGIEPQIEILKDISIDEELPWFAEQIRHQQRFHVSDVATLPPAARLEREHFEAQGIQSLIVVPIKTADRLIGFLGFDAVKKSREWKDDDIALLRFFGQTLSNVIERKRAESALRQSEEKYRLIAENMAEIITTLDMELNFTYVSPSILKLRGFTVEEALKQKIDQIMTPESFQRLSEAFAEELSLEQTGTADPDRARVMELDEYKKDGSIIRVENTASFIRDGEKKPVGILVISRDITERKKMETALKQSEELFRLTIQLSPIGVGIVDSTGKLVDCNDSLAKIVGYRREELLNLNFADFTHKDDLQQEWQLINALWENKTTAYRMEKRYIHKDGHTVLVDVAASLIKGESGELAYGFAFVQDITDRKRNEEQLEKNLKEKELLLSEIHHRVKNNLQIVSSLLNLHSKQTKDQKALAVIEESRQRIQSMGLIHEQLYRSEDFTSIDMKKFILDLIRTQRTMAISGKKGVEYEVGIDNIFFEIDMATPVGLIINEIITNSLKYAFPERDDGIIGISLAALKNDEYELLIFDNGIGLSQEIVPDTTKTFGLYLVKMLVKAQLKGSLEIDRTTGTRFIIRFKKSDYCKKR